MSLRSSVRLLLLLALVPLPACSRSAASNASESDIQVDTLPSGTIRVRNGGTPAWRDGTAWRLVEDLRLGSVDTEGPELFAQVAAILTDERGRIYVLDYPTQEIRVFSAEGEFIRRIGGEGDGPGELVGVAGLDWGPDGNLWVWGSRQYYVLDPEGREIARHPRMVRGVIYSWQGGFDTRGRYIDFGLDREILDRQMDGNRLVVTLSGLTTFYPVVFTPPGQFDSLPVIDFHAQVTEDGGLMRGGRSMEATLDGDDIWFIHTDDYTVYRRSLDGDTLLVFTLPATPVPVPQSEVDETIASIREAGGTPPGHEEFVMERPVVTKVVTDRGGLVYVFPQEPGVGTGEAVDVFEKSGRYLGRMDFAAPVLVDRPAPYVTRDHMYVVENDEVGVPFVVRYRIERP